MDDFKENAKPFELTANENSTAKTILTINDPTQLCLPLINGTNEGDLAKSHDFWQ